MFWMVLALLAFLAGVLCVFLMNWPWRRSDQRKLVKYLSENGSRLDQMTSGWWQKWQRVGRLATITLREYKVAYTDKVGSLHHATARFYIPWWLNKGFYNPGCIDNWDLIETQS